MDLEEVNFRNIVLFFEKELREINRTGRRYKLIGGCTSATMHKLGVLEHRHNGRCRIICLTDRAKRILGIEEVNLKK